MPVEQFVNAAVRRALCETQAMGTTQQQRKHFVFLLHGIRTDAPWAEMVRDVLQQSPEITRVIPIGYGYFDSFRFVIPGPWRSAGVKRFVREYDQLIARHRDADVSVLAHSFGTYAVARALDEEQHIHLRHFCMAGSIVPRWFPWARVMPRISGRVVNDCGTMDEWPVIAESATVGFGDTGTSGCKTQHVEDRYHAVGHSGFFSRPFVEAYWLPLFAKGEIAAIPGAGASPRAAQPWYRAVLKAVKLWWFAVATLILALALATQAYFAAPDLDPSGLDVGLSQDFYAARLGAPRVSRHGSIRCGDNLYSAHYARWAPDDFGRDIITIAFDSTVGLLVIRDFIRQRSGYSYPNLSWRLGFDSLGSMSQNHMGVWFHDDQRFPIYVERHYFGSPGGGRDFYFAVGTSGGYTRNRANYRSLHEARPATDMGEDYSDEYKRLRNEAIPYGVAIEADGATPRACRNDNGPEHTSWSSRRLSLLALDPKWIDDDLQNGEEWWAR